MIKNKSYRSLSLAVLLGVASIAHATGAGFYYGVMVGNSNTNNEPKDMTGNTLPNAGNPTPIYAPIGGNYNCSLNSGGPPYSYSCTQVQNNVSPSNTGLGAGIYIGANFNKYAGMEFGYKHFAASEYNGDQLDPTRTSEIQENALDLLFKGQVPFGKVGLFAKGGMAYVRKTAGGSLTEPSSSGKRTGTTNNIRPELGLGVFYDFTPNWEVDFSANRIFGGGNGFRDADLYAVGVSYHFVTLYCGQFIC